MIFTETVLSGAYVIDLEPQADERGFFARIWCAREFAARGLESRLVQSSVSVNTRRGTLRGIHYQAPPHAEVKLVRCTRGAVFDVIIDLRPDSATYLRPFGIELTAENRLALYIPKGFAHGFQTVVDDTEVFYHMSEVYVAAAGRGLRWNDPTFGVPWPIVPPILLARDATYPDFARDEHG
ncbi:MAG: dTDP-4-dehydrorhamnose 3,5-epimerase [Gemmatimonadetes bacterium]|nr:MAG: dTDP-4-dehydrorhamnose 3,5-epimerase [Gemmatimonadota bacterium]